MSSLNDQSSFLCSLAEETTTLRACMYIHRLWCFFIIGYIASLIVSKYIISFSTYNFKRSTSPMWIFTHQSSNMSWKTSIISNFQNILTDQIKCHCQIIYFIFHLFFILQSLVIYTYFYFIDVGVRNIFKRDDTIFVRRKDIICILILGGVDCIFEFILKTERHSNSNESMNYVKLNFIQVAYYMFRFRCS